MADSPTFPTDEDLCEIIDGTASSEVLDRLGADPDARERVRSVEDAIARLRASTIEAPDPADVDELVARALNEATPEQRRRADTEPPAVRSGIRAVPRGLVAAAVIGLAAIGLGLIWSGTRSSESGSESVAGQPVLLDLGPPADLGGHADIAALRHELANGLLETAADVETDGEPPATADGTAPDLAEPEPEPATPNEADDTGDTGTTSAAIPGVGRPTDESLSRCAIQIVELLANEGLDPTPIKVGVATVDGNEVFVYEFRVLEGEHDRLISIVAPTDCNPQATFVLDR